MNAVEVDQNELLASLCRESFVDFVKEFWDCIPGSQPLDWNWHMDVLCNALQAVGERIFAGRTTDADEIHNLIDIYNISPGTSKSSICTILFPGPWTWTRMPTARHLVASHTADLVLDLASKARDVIQSDKYRSCFPDVEIRESHEAKGLYRNTFGGDRIAATVGGRSPMGFHGHFLVVDDPIDPKKAVSSADLMTASKFMTEVIPSRCVRGFPSSTVLVMQRIHRGDPTQVLLDIAKKEGSNPVRHYCIPAELTDKVKPQELKERYKNGLMDPLRLSKSVLNGEKTKNAFAYSSQYLQDPVPAGSGMFKEDYFNKRVRAAPYDAKRILYIDRAATQDGGCATAMVLLALDKDQNYYVEHVVRGQWEPDERNRRIKAEALRCRDRYGPKHEPRIWVEREGGSSGRDAWKMLAKAMDGFSIQEDLVTGAKDVRAEPWQTQLAAGNVYIVDDGSWDVAGYVEEHCAFAPEGVGKRLGGFKDQVDASTGGYNLLSGNRSGVGQFRVVTYKGLLDAKKNDKGLRCALVTREELPEFHSEETSLLVRLIDKGDESADPPHALDKLQGQLKLAFDDVQPSEHQVGWLDPVRDGKPCSELMMDRDQGKRIWAWLNRQMQLSEVGLLVVCDDRPRRGSSLAMAVIDCLGRKREAILRVGGPDESFVGEPANKHVFDLTKLGRSMVHG